MSNIVEISNEASKLKSFEVKRSYQCNHKDWVSLTESWIQLNPILDFVKSSNCGAVSSFLGTTRDIFEDKVVTHLEYEAYEEMALPSMLTICEKIRSSWDVENIAIQHKLGSCPVGEISVAIYVSSQHRKDSLEAIQFAIDELKRTVPIWKKEHYMSGDATWKENVIQVVVDTDSTSA